MLKGMTRILAFFTKEVNEVRRQPRLVLSLVLGPALVLLLFGLGFKGDRPVLRTAMVFPSDFEPAQREAIVQLANLNFQVESVGNDSEDALRRLAAGQLEVVQVIPGDIEQRVLDGEQPRVEFFANTINPQHEQWIQYLAYTLVNEINRAVLTEATTALQRETATVLPELQELRTQLDALEEGISLDERERAIELLERVRGSTGLAALAAPLLEPYLNNAENETVQESVAGLQSDLSELEQLLQSDQLRVDAERLDRARTRVDQLELAVTTLQQLPPDRIVSPLQRNYTNIRGEAYDLMIYYAPGVLALMLQHIAVTLGALALVRERLLGAIEIFQVAPISAGQLVLGKYLGYTLFIGLMTAALAVALSYLGVPWPSNWPAFVGLLLLMTLASLGLGFVISVSSRSDSQAIQLSMLVLLMSIFFGGFFLPLENFQQFIQVLAGFLPISHGIRGLHDLVLSGQVPDWFTWAALGGLVLVTFVIANLAVRRDFATFST